MDTTRAAYQQAIDNGHEEAVAVSVRSIQRLDGTVAPGQRSDPPQTTPRDSALYPAVGEARRRLMSPRP
jgi:hypothetical protein